MEITDGVKVGIKDLGRKFFLKNSALKNEQVRKLEVVPIVDKQFTKCPRLAQVLLHGG